MFTGDPNTNLALCESNFLPGKHFDMHQMSGRRNPRGATWLFISSWLSVRLEGLMRGLTVPLSLAAMLALGACAQNGSAPESFVMPPQDELVHALMAERIGVLYQRIEVLAFDQNRTLPELDEDRRRVATEIAEAAQSLNEAAVELTTLSLLPETLSLPVSTRQQFQSLSQRLQETSAEVAQAAEEFSAGRLASSIVGLQAICSTCHDLYRGS